MPQARDVLSDELDRDAAASVADDGRVRVAPTVLYIEDTPANVELVRRILERRGGMRLVVAPTGEQGLELARKEIPAIVLLDLHLPGLSGQEVLTGLRSDPSTRDIPIVVTSGSGPEAMALDESDPQTGPDAYLPKPFRIDDFLGLIERFLR